MRRRVVQPAVRAIQDITSAQQVDCAFLPVCLRASMTYFSLTLYALVPNCFSISPSGSACSTLTCSSCNSGYSVCSATGQCYVSGLCSPHYFELCSFRNLDPNCGTRTGSCACSQCASPSFTLCPKSGTCQASRLLRLLFEVVFLIAFFLIENRFVLIC